jgi:ribosomal protein S18 acetylase RimI-like enzyme
MSTQTITGVESRTSSEKLLQRVRIRLMAEADLQGLEWGGEYAHFRKLYADAYQRYQRGLSVLWVAEMHGIGIIGQVFIQLSCDRLELADGVRRAYLYSFRIKPAYRRLGLGSRIMDVVEEDLRRKGFRTVTLNVAKENADAQRLYRRRGYQVVAHESGIWSYPDQHGVWHQVEEPAWRMEKDIS